MKYEENRVRAVLCRRTLNLCLGRFIFELRPLMDRILSAAWNGSGFVLLHVFMKRTQKTPQREIERAERNFTDYQERSKHDEG